MQLLFDIERSLKVNPPKYGKGIKWIKRKAGKLNSLVVEDENGISLNPREKDLNKEPGQDPQLQKSFKTHGPLYEKPVMIAELRPDDKEELQSGFNRRDNLMIGLGVGTYFWDLIEYESPFYKTLWKRRFNATEDHVVKGTPNTEGTYLKGLVEAKNGKQFDPTDDEAVKEALRFMSTTPEGRRHLDDEDIEKLLGKFRKTNSKEVGVIAFDTPAANRAAKKIGLPTNGYVKDISLDSYDTSGYVRYKGDFSSKIVDMVDLFDKYGKPIEITGFIQEVVHDKIKDQRTNWKKAFDKTVEWIKEHLHERYHDMVVFKGFLAQISTKDETQEGKPRERGLVDVNGKIIKE